MSGGGRSKAPTYDALEDRIRAANALMKDMKDAARDLRAVIAEARELVELRLESWLHGLDEKIVAKANSMIATNKAALEQRMLEAFESSIDKTNAHLEEMREQSQKHLDRIADMCDQNGDVAVMLAVRMLMAHGGRYDVPGEDRAFILVQQKGGVTSPPRGKPVWIVVQEDVPHAEDIINYVNQWVAHQYAAQGLRPLVTVEGRPVMFNPVTGATRPAEDVPS